MAFISADDDTNRKKKFTPTTLPLRSQGTVKVDIGITSIKKVFFINSSFGHPVHLLDLLLDTS